MIPIRVSFHTSKAALLSFLFLIFHSWPIISGYEPVTHFVTSYQASERLSAFRMFASLNILQQNISSNKEFLPTIQFYHACLIADPHEKVDQINTIEEEQKIMGSIGVRLWVIDDQNKSSRLSSSLQCSLTIASNLFTDYGRYVDTLIYVDSHFVPVSLDSWAALLMKTQSMSGAARKNAFYCLLPQSVSNPLLQYRQVVKSLNCDLSLHSFTVYDGHFLHDTIKSTPTLANPTSIREMMRSLQIHLHLLNPIIVNAGIVWSSPSPSFSSKEVLFIEFDGDYHRLQLVPNECWIDIGIKTPEFNTVQIIQDSLFSSILKDQQESLVKHLSGCVVFSLAPRNTIDTTSMVKPASNFRQNAILNATAITREVLMKTVDGSGHFSHELEVANDAYRRFMKSSYAELIADTALASSKPKENMKSVTIVSESKTELRKTLPRVLDVAYNNYQISSGTSLSTERGRYMDLLAMTRRHVEEINDVAHFHILLNSFQEEEETSNTNNDSFELSLETLSQQYQGKIALASMPGLPSPKDLASAMQTVNTPPNELVHDSFLNFLSIVQELAQLLLKTPVPTSIGLLVQDNFEEKKGSLVQLDDWHYRSTDLVIVSCVDSKIPLALVENIQQRYKFRNQELRRRMGKTSSKKVDTPYRLRLESYGLNGHNQCPFDPFAISVAELRNLLNSTAKDANKINSVWNWYFQPSTISLLVA